MNEVDSSTGGPVTDLDVIDIDDNTTMGKEAVPATDQASINNMHVTEPKHDLSQSLTSTTHASDPPSHSPEGATASSVVHSSSTSSAIGSSTISSNSHGLPSFLSAAMITYLCSVSTMSPWQDLLTEYLDFEKEGPITGVCFSLSVFCTYSLQWLQQTHDWIYIRKNTSSLDLTWVS